MDRRPSRRRALATLTLPLAACAGRQEPPAGAPPPAAVPGGRTLLYAQSGATLRAFSVNAASGALSPIDGGVGVSAPRSPCYLSADAARGRLWAACDGGMVASFAIDRRGRLVLRSAAPSPDGPCYVHAHPGGKLVLSANYGGVAWVAPVDEQGRPGEGKTLSTGPTTHSARFHPGGRFAYVLAVSPKKIAQFAVDEAGGALAPLATAELTKEGWGPRHIAFSPDGKRAFVMHERPLKVTSFSVGEDGGLTELSEQPALRPGTTPDNDLCGAEIAVHPSGKFVYGSVRNPKGHLDHNVILTLAVDGDGKLGAPAFTSTGGIMPRGFALDPSGSFLFAANESEGRLLTFRVDAGTGALAQVAETRVAPRAIGLAVVTLPA